MDKFGREFALVVGESASHQHRSGKAHLMLHPLAVGALVIGAVRAGVINLFLELLESLPPGRTSEELGDALRRHHFVFLLPVAQEAVVKDDVGVEDFARLRIHARRAHGEAGLGGDPAEEVVVDVFGIDVFFPRLVFAGLIDVDGVVIAELLKRLVPFQDAFGHVRTKRFRHRFFDIKRDRLDRCRDASVRTFLLQVPTVDVADEVLVVLLVRKVLADREEIADAVVRLPRLVIGGGKTAETVMHGHLHAMRIDDGVQVLHAAINGVHAELDILLEGLDFPPGRAVGGEVERHSGKADRSTDPLVVVHKGPREIDHVAPIGIGDDGQRIKDAVAIGHRDGFGLRCSRIGRKPHIAAKHMDIVADLLEYPEHVVVEAPGHATDHVVVANPLGDRGQDDEFLVEVA